MKKSNAEMKALLQLKQMVQDLISEDFKSNKMPKMMAIKVTKVEPVKKLEVSDEELPSEEAPLVDGLLPEVCEECQMEDCGCEVPVEGPAESPAVLKLKKLLGK